jgi:hypothetical protein
LRLNGDVGEKGLGLVIMRTVGLLVLRIIELPTPLTAYSFAHLDDAPLRE